MSENLIHFLITCNNCNKSVRGNRYKCKTCEDYDLCDTCFEENKPKEHKDHEFEVIKPDETLFKDLTCGFHNCSNKLKNTVYVCTYCTDLVHKNNKLFFLCKECFIKKKHDEKHEITEINSLELIRQRNALMIELENRIEPASKSGICCVSCNLDGVSYICTSLMLKGEHLCTKCMLKGYLPIFSWSKLQ
jgi:hypothetical protein